MSKASKNRAKLERLKAKRSQRAANAAKYESWAGTDKNKKRKSWSVFATRRVGKHEHAIPDCGNIACFRCHGIISIPAAVGLRAKTHGVFEARKLEKRLARKYA